MARRTRLRLADVPFHVIQRGHNRNPCFFSDRDHCRYLLDLQEQAGRHGVAVHAYTLMTNHVHLLMTPNTSDAVSHMMKALGQRYAQYINRSRSRSGTLWGGRFRSCLVDTESYLLTCYRYVEMNPVRAGMVPTPNQYPWSSYRANAEGVPDPLITPHPCVLALGPTVEERRTAYRQLFDCAPSDASVEQIRLATNRGLPLGNQQFVDRMAALFGKSVIAGRKGRRPC